MPATETPTRRDPAATLQFGDEIANAWGWLLNRAPRIARHLEEIPGAAKMFANVLAGIDLIIRQDFGGDAKAFARRCDMDVSINSDRTYIMIRIVDR